MIASPQGFAFRKGLSPASPIPSRCLSARTVQVIPTPPPGSIKALRRRQETPRRRAPPRACTTTSSSPQSPTYTTSAGTVGIIFSTQEDFRADSLWYFLLATGASRCSVPGSWRSRSSSSPGCSSSPSAVADASRIGSHSGRPHDTASLKVLGRESYPEALPARDRDQHHGWPTRSNSPREGEAVVPAGDQPRPAYAADVDSWLRRGDRRRRSPDLPRAAAVVISEARRLDRLIGDLLDLARLRAHQFSLNFVPFDIVTVVTISVEAWTPAVLTARDLITPRYRRPPVADHR